jgi:hemolysin III
MIHKLLADSRFGRHPGNAFPVYSRAEFLADATIHVLGVTAALAAVAWLLLRSWHGVRPGILLSLLIYCSGLLGMLSASAAYNITPASPAKAILRRLDHAMIYVMIAGTYTPFALAAIGGGQGLALAIISWSAAVLGIVLKVGFPGRIEWFGFALYLGMGWMVVVVINQVFQALSITSFMLLICGGVIYTLGAAVHCMHRLRFHNAYWHGLVVIAVTSHFAAVVSLPALKPAIG